MVMDTQKRYRGGTGFQLLKSIYSALDPKEVFSNARNNSRMDNNYYPSNNVYRPTGLPGSSDNHIHPSLFK